MPVRAPTGIRRFGRWNRPVPQGAIGLKESWYAIKKSIATRHHKNRGLYEVFRGSKAENLNFELVAFSPKPPK